MIRLLLLLAFITALGLCASWVAGNPGSVTIYWFDWRIDTSFAFLLAIAVAGGIALAYLYILSRALVLAPVHFSERRQLKHYRKGLTELTYSVAALAAADTKTAEEHTRKAEKLLGNTPLTLLLSAQIARSQGDDAKTKLLLEQMLGHKETEYLAARSLSDAASKQHLFSRALPLAERASKVNPREKSSATALIGLHIRMGQWQEALLAADKAAKKGGLTRRERNYYKGIIYLKQGTSLLDKSQPEAALANAWASMKHIPHFAPAVILTARSFIGNSQNDKAIKLILKHWRDAPHPELAATFRIAMAKEPEEKQLKLVKKLAAHAPNHAESKIAVAETAIKFKQWETARTALKDVLATEESARACKLMAYVEQGEFSDFDASGRWLGRSSEAPADSVWMCGACSTTTDHWDTHCPACGAFDALNWKQPTIRFVQ